MRRSTRWRVRVRVGVHIGDALAGTMGTKQYAYLLWGTALQRAMAQEGASEPGRVRVSAGCIEKLLELADVRLRAGGARGGEGAARAAADDDARCMFFDIQRSTVRGVLPPGDAYVRPCFAAGDERKQLTRHLDTHVAAQQKAGRFGIGAYRFEPAPSLEEKAAAKKAAGEKATTYDAPSGWWPPPVRDSERPRDDTPGSIMAVQQLLAGE